MNKYHYYDLKDTSKTLCGRDHTELYATPNIENVTCFTCIEIIKDKVALAIVRSRKRTTKNYVNLTKELS